MVKTRSWIIGVPEPLQETSRSSPLVEVNQAIISLVVKTKLVVLKFVLKQTNPDTEFKMVRGRTIKIGELKFFLYSLRYCPKFNGHKSVNFYRILKIQISTV